MTSIHYIVNVEVVIAHGDRYLMEVRSEQEVHAPGVLCFAGGKVEDAGTTSDILEETARREALEETGVRVGEVVYVESKSFTIADGTGVIDIVFLGRYLSGEAVAGDPDEVGSLAWLTFDEVKTHPKCPPWTLDSIIRAETLRRELGWD